MNLSYENFEKEVNEKLFEKWQLGLPYYRWGKGKIITCDDAIDKATMQPCGCEILINEKWYFVGKSVEDASNGLKFTIINPILKQYPDYSLVVLNELMEPYVIKSTLKLNEIKDSDLKEGLIAVKNTSDSTEIISGWGFVAGFYGGFVKNPVSKNLFVNKGV